MAIRVMVIGGTGLVGSHLLKQLSAADHIGEIISLTRRPVEVVDQKIKNHVVDFARLEDFTDLFEVDTFYSCLGTTAKRAGSIEKQRQVDYHYQLKAAKLAHQNRVSHYLLVSSSGANARSLNPYLRMKGELEEAVMQLDFDAISIFQPSLLLGQREESRFAEGLGSMILPTLCKLPGLSRYRPIHAKEVAKKMVKESAGVATGIRTFTLDRVFLN